MYIEVMPLTSVSWPDDIKAALKNIFKDIHKIQN